MDNGTTINLKFTNRPKNGWGMFKSILAGRPAQAPEERLGVRFESEWLGAMADPKTLARYRRVCGLKEDGRLPMLYVHAMAMPLHMAMFISPSFPLRLFGLLHFSNSTEALRPIRDGERMDLRARIDGITPSPRGQMFTILTDVSVDGTVVWRETSVYLSPLPAGDRKKTDKPAGQASVEPDWGKPVAEWSLKADAGRKFSGPAGDPNPIHMSAITAKMFGFKRAIAHGMYSAARCLAIMERNRPVDGPCRFEVRFKKPLFIPGSVALHTATEEDGTRFVLKVKPRGEPHIDGRFTKAQVWD